MEVYVDTEKENMKSELKILKTKNSEDTYVKINSDDGLWFRPLAEVKEKIREEIIQEIKNEKELLKQSEVNELENNINKLIKNSKISYKINNGKEIEIKNIKIHSNKNKEEENKTK